MAQTDYQRRKLLEERKNAQGLFRRSYYQDQDTIDLINQVKAEISESTGQTATNDMAMASIIAFYRLNLEFDAD